MEAQYGSIHVSYDSREFRFVVGFSWVPIAIWLAFGILLVLATLKTGMWILLIGTLACIAGAIAVCRDPVSVWKMRLDERTLSVHTRRGVAKFDLPATVVYYEQSDISKFMIETGAGYVTVYPGPCYIMREQLPAFLNMTAHGLLKKCEGSGRWFS